MNYYLAIDIGASSGRHILGHVENGKMILEEMYRFDNLQVHKNGHDCWDMDNLWNGILGGLKACKELGKMPYTVCHHRHRYLGRGLCPAGRKGQCFG